MLVSVSLGTSCPGEAMRGEKKSRDTYFDVWPQLETDTRCSLMSKKL